MTALNVFLFSDAAVVMTDGLRTNLDGTDRAIIHKVMMLPNCGGIVATRGPATVLPAIAAVMSRHASFDAASAAMAGDLRLMMDSARGQTPSLPQPPEVYLVGRSESRGQFESWICLAQAVSGLDAYEARRTNTLLLPDPSGCDARTQRLAARARAEDGRFNPDTDGVKLMRGQMRAYPKDVGGFCQQTIVKADGITTRVLERWPETAAA